MIFVNHGDDDSCTGFAKTIQDHFGIEAIAPYYGAEYDLLRHEWIRITDPVWKEKSKKKEAEHAAVLSKNESLYRNLVQAGQDLSDLIRSLEGHSNAEIKALTNKIRDLL